jgi:peptide chain release factor subunit 1
LLATERRTARDRLEAFCSRLRDDEPVAYGIDEVVRATEFGAVDPPLDTATVPREQRQELETAGSQQGGECFVLSTETERGNRFASTFGGVGALLRFPVN